MNSRWRPRWVVLTDSFLFYWAVEKDFWDGKPHKVCLLRWLCLCVAQAVSEAVKRFEAVFLLCALRQVVNVQGHMAGPVWWESPLECWDGVDKGGRTDVEGDKGGSLCE
eukprot:3397799-Rhodomonas_salina.5